MAFLWAGRVCSCDTPSESDSHARLANSPSSSPLATPMRKSSSRVISTCRLSMRRCQFSRTLGSPKRWVSPSRPTGRRKYRDSLLESAEPGAHPLGTRSLAPLLLRTGRGSAEVVQLMGKRLLHSFSRKARLHRHERRPCLRPSVPYEAMVLKMEGAADAPAAPSTLPRRPRSASLGGSGWCTFAVGQGRQSGPDPGCLGT